MSISRIAASIGESATLKLNATAAALRKQGEPVIHLGGGEPKSKAPEAALAAAAEYLATGEIRYTPVGGTPTLKQAIVRYTERFYGHAVEPKNVMVSGGAKQSIMVALQTVLDPGNEVVFPAPYWVSYPDMVRLCGATPVVVRPQEDPFRPTLQEIEEKVGPSTKAMILNSPSNPSGMVYSDELIAGVVRLCEERGIYLIMDDIYHRLVFDDVRPASCFAHARVSGDDSRLISINGVSKQFAMTGFRIGWAVASAKLIKVMTDIQGHQTSGPSALSQRAALGALDGDQSSVNDLCRTLQQNREVLMEQMGAFKGVEVSRPDGTFYCFADLRHYDEDSTRLAAFLLEKARVVTVPGVEFGMDGHLRLSFCGAAEELVAGIERMKWALDPDAPRELSIGDHTLKRDW